MNCPSLRTFVEGAPCREKPIGEKLIGIGEIAQTYSLAGTTMHSMLGTVVRNPVDFWTHVANGGLWFGAGVNVTSCQVCCGPKSNWRSVRQTCLK